MNATREAALLRRRAAEAANRRAEQIAKTDALAAAAGMTPIQYLNHLEGLAHREGVSSMPISHTGGRQ